MERISAYPPLGLLDRSVAPPCASLFYNMSEKEFSLEALEMENLKILKAFQPPAPTQLDPFQYTTCLKNFVQYITTTTVGVSHKHISTVIIITNTNVIITRSHHRNLYVSE